MGKVMILLLGYAFLTNPYQKESLAIAIKNRIDNQPSLSVLNNIIPLFSDFLYDVDNYVFFSIGYVKHTRRPFAFGIFGTWFFFGSSK